MSEYLHVEKPFLDQLAALGWKVIDQGQGFIPSDPARSLRAGFREWLLPEVFRKAILSINLTGDGKPWLTNCQLDDLRDQILRQPNRNLLEANETAQGLFLKAQVDVNEVTGESDPVVQADRLCPPRAQPVPRHQPVPHRHARLREDLHHPGHRAVRERHSAGGHGGEDRRRQHGQPDVRGLRAASALSQWPVRDGQGRAARGRATALL